MTCISESRIDIIYDSSHYSMFLRTGLHIMAEEEDLYTKFNNISLCHLFINEKQ